MKKEICSSNDKIVSGFVKVVLYPRLYNYFSYMCYVPEMISQQDVSILLLLEINFLNTKDKPWTLTNITTTISPKSAVPTIVNCNTSTLPLLRT